MEQSSQPETWAMVAGSTKYMVSTLGRVKSLSRAVMSGRGAYRTLRETVLAQWTCKQTGYLQCKVDGRKRNVHDLVLKTFVGPRPGGHCCAHWDGNKRNPALTNLRWATYSENSADMVRHGTSQRGGRNRMTRLSEEAVRAIRSDPRTRRAIAKDYGVTPEAISHIVLRKNWKWVE